MRILHVNHALSVGGAEVMIIELAKEQQALGHQVTICSMLGRAALDDKARAAGLEVVHLNSGSSLFAKASALTKYLRQHPTDILNSHWAVWLPTGIAARRTGTVHVHTHHSNESRRTFPEHRIAKLFTDKVVGLTPGLDEYITKWVGVPAARIAVIPNGIDRSKIDGATRVEIDGIPPQAQVVGMVARMALPKDYLTFLHAAKIVLDKLPEAHFVAVGDGPMRGQLEAEAAQLGLTRFHFLGRRLDVPSLLRRMTIKVLSTFNEGLPISLLESMASGCTCIATDIPPNRYTLEEGVSGLLVPGQDPDALASAIENILLDDNLRHRLSENALRRSQYFNSRRMAEDYVGLYASLLQNRGKDHGKPDA